jgi:hypothetical protein
MDGSQRGFDWFQSCFVGLERIIGIRNPFSTAKKKIEKINTYKVVHQILGI